ncbi:MAG: hypothetical protein IPK87_00765 [Planctomycetes bacterium]|nr:hypothetical protein [Planctomycetota bacterium]
MKPIFTIHEGEFLVGEHINRDKHLAKRFNVWVPTKDSGVDLLVTRKKRDGRPVGLQVKFSRSYWFIKELAGKVQATSWFRLDPAKIRNSTADLWVFVIITLKHKQHFVVIPTRELAKRIPKKCGKRWDLYLWVYPGKKCYNMRDVCNEDRVAALDCGVKDRARDFTRWLENWDLLQRP